MSSTTPNNLEKMSNEDLFDMIKDKIFEQKLDDIKNLYHDNINDKEDFLYYAIQIGNHEIIQFFLDKGYILNLQHIANASSYGQLETIKFLRSLGCQWNDMTTTQASIFGHIECLKYAIENGCDYSWALRNASLYGKLNCIRYLVEEKKEFVDLITVELAAQSGNLNTIKYFHQIHAPFGKSVLKVAKEARKKNIVNYLIDNVGLRDNSVDYY
jgi:hypothetical protein